MSKPIGVYGIGSVLMGDDGFGPFVVRHFKARYEVPPHVSVRDLGTPGINLAADLVDLGALIVVDTVKSDAAPGTLLRYDQTTLMNNAPGVRTSPHEPTLSDALLTARFLGGGPAEILLLGTPPGKIEMKYRMGDELRQCAEATIDAMVETLQGWGVTVTRRPEPLPAEIWWEMDHVDPHSIEP